MDGACSTDGGGVHRWFWWGDVIEREELSLDGTIIIIIIIIIINGFSRSGMGKQ